MDTKKPQPGPVLTESGIYIKGVVISSKAQKITKKDGGVLAIVKHEISTDPGVVVLQEFLDPKVDLHVKIEGDEVSTFPKLEQFKSVTVKAESIEDKRGHATVSKWKRVHS